MQIMNPTSVPGALGLAVLVITVVYSVPSVKIVLHEVFTWRRNRSES
jgi:hypothetical protein